MAGARILLGPERPCSGARNGEKILASRPVAGWGRTPEDTLTGIDPALGDPNEEDLTLAAPDDARGRRPDTEFASPRYRWRRPGRNLRAARPARSRSEQVDSYGHPILHRQGYRPGRR